MSDWIDDTMNSVDAIQIQAEELKRLEQQIADAHKINQDYGNEIDRLQSENAKLKEEIERLNKYTISGCEIMIDELKSDLAAALEVIEFANDHLNSMDNYSVVAGARHSLSEFLGKLKTGQKQRETSRQLSSHEKSQLKCDPERDFENQYLSKFPDKSEDEFLGKVKTTNPTSN